MTEPMSYREIMEGLRRRFDEIKDVSPVFEDIRSKQLVKQCKSCAIIGCGNGEIELAFIDLCMPALEELTAVEPDADSVVELKERLARQLPSVRSSVYQDLAESWAARNVQMFDVVIMFHCVSDIPESVRPVLFNRLFESVIRPNGLLIITTRTGRLDGTQTTESRIMEALNYRPYLDSKWYADARKLIQSVGFSNCYERSYGIDVNVENLDEAYFAFYARECDESTSLEQVEQVVRSVIGNAKSSRKEFAFGVFRKPIE